MATFTTKQIDDAFAAADTVNSDIERAFTAADAAQPKKRRTQFGFGAMGPRVEPLPTKTRSEVAADMVKDHDQTGLSYPDLFGIYDQAGSQSDKAAALDQLILRRQYRGVLDEIGMGLESGAANVEGSAAGTLGSALRRVARSPLFYGLTRFGPFNYDAAKVERVGAAWDDYAQQLYDYSSSPLFQPGKGAGAGGWLANTVAKTAPMMGLATGATLATGGAAGGFLVGAVVEGDNAYREALADGASEEEAQMARYVVGTVNGVIEVAQVGHIMKLGKGASKAVAKEFAGEASDRALKKIARVVGKLGKQHIEASIKEGLEEVAQEWVGAGAATIIYDKDIDVEDMITRRSPTAFAGGAGAGFFLGGGSLVFNAATEIAEATTPAQAEPEIPQMPMVATKETYDAAVAEREKAVAAQQAETKPEAKPTEEKQTPPPATPTEPTVEAKAPGEAGPGEWTEEISPKTGDITKRIRGVVPKGEEGEGGAIEVTLTFNKDGSLRWVTANHPGTHNFESQVQLDIGFFPDGAGGFRALTVHDDPSLVLPRIDDIITPATQETMPGAAGPGEATTEKEAEHAERIPETGELHADVHEQRRAQEGQEEVPAEEGGEALRTGRPTTESVGAVEAREPWEMTREEYAPPPPAGVSEEARHKGMLDVSAVRAGYAAVLRGLEPARLVIEKHGRAPYAEVIKAMHRPEAETLEFNDARLDAVDATVSEFEKELQKYPDNVLEMVMLSRGHGLEGKARALQREAFAKMPKALKDSKIRRALDEIADDNYRYLQEVAGKDVGKVEDYFYGIYKGGRKVSAFLKHWRTTDRYTKRKSFPTYADAKAFGLEARTKNPVENLRREFQAIARRTAMQQLHDYMMAEGKGIYIEETDKAPADWDFIGDPLRPEPAFVDARVEPTMAALINSLISTNKITQNKALNVMRKVNNALRSLKFIGSAFHAWQIAKQSIADTGFLGFYKGTSRTGFKALFTNMTKDPALRPAYRDYIEHGGGHQYSIESEAQRAVKSMMHELDAGSRVILKGVAAPFKVPVGFVNWMFEQYIPAVKFGKYLDSVGEAVGKQGRELTSVEKIELIKEQQNFYGMMNERLFGRSGTVTTALRFIFMAPGYAEGNYRTMFKAATQWGRGAEGYSAGRSRRNIVNSWVVTGTLATIGTIILTGKPPEKPEDLDDVRDLLKIDTGKRDQHGDRIMIDLASYDKDYWNVAFNTLRGRPDKAVTESLKRIGGMKATSFEMLHDAQSLFLGKAIYDWKGDMVYRPTDPFVEKMAELFAHELRRLVPISVSVFSQSRNKGLDDSVAAMEALIGLRPTYDEDTLSKRAAMRDCWDLREKREALAWRLDQYKDPWGAIEYYNEQVKRVLKPDFVPNDMRQEWEKKLLIDPVRVLNWKHFPPHAMTLAQLRKAIASHIYKKPYTRSDGRRYPAGHPHTGYEDRVATLRAELQKRSASTQGTRSTR